MRNKFPMGSVMKKMAPVLLASVFLLPLSAQAEIKAGSVEVTPFGGYNFFEKRQNLEDQPLVGGRLGYNFTNSFGIEGTWEFMKSYVDNKNLRFSREGQFTRPINDVSITQFSLDLVYHFMPESVFNPYIVGGYGIAHYSPKINNKNMSVVNFGLGAKYWVAEHVALRADVRDNMVLDESIHNVETTLGVVFAFGGESKKAAAPLPVDSDNDGVTDNLDKCPGTPAGVKVDANGCPLDSDKDGVTDDLDKCPNTPAGVKVGPDGCPPDSDHDGVTDDLDKCPGTPEGVKVDKDGCPPVIVVPAQVKAAAAERFCSKPAVLAINFDSDKTDIKPRYHDELKTVGDFLSYFPNAKGEISGHTDSTAGNAHNQSLSERRAESVEKYISTTFKVNKGRITTKGYGEAKPVASNKTKAGRAKNRRIVANFTCE